MQIKLYCLLFLIYMLSSTVYADKQKNSFLLGVSLQSVQETRLFGLNFETVFSIYSEYFALQMHLVSEPKMSFVTESTDYQILNCLYKKLYSMNNMSLGISSGLSIISTVHTHFIGANKKQYSLYIGIPLQIDYQITYGIFSSKYTFSYLFFGENKTITSHTLGYGIKF